MPGGGGLRPGTAAMALALAVARLLSLTALLAVAAPAAAQAQADGRAVAAPAAPPARWLTLVERRSWPHQQLDLASVEPLPGTDEQRLRYRVRGTRFGAQELWLAARCARWERAETASRAQAGAAELRWFVPVFGSVEDAELAAVCAQPQVPAAQPPGWSEAARLALLGAWEHGVGRYAYTLRIVDADSEAEARRASVSRWDDGRWPHVTRHIDGLLDLPPALRLTVAELYRDGQRSRPVRVTDRSGGAPHWLIIERVSTSTRVAPADSADFARRARRWIAQGHLAEPAVLLADERERARLAYWRAPLATQIQALPAFGLDPDVRYANHMTPLTEALFTGRWDSARALLARGADPNLCGLLGCPLALAHHAGDRAGGRLMLAALLNAGARVDQIDPHYAAATTTVLTDVVRDAAGNPAGTGAQRPTGAATNGPPTSDDQPGPPLDLIEQLLALGASPDGAAEVSITPLHMAATRGQRALAERLLQAGASPLPWRDRNRGAYGQLTTLVDAAAESQRPELIAWAEDLMRQAAASSPRWRFAVHIEQDGRVFPLVDGARLELRAAPFHLVLTLPAGSEASLSLASSLSPGWAAEVQRGEPGNGLFVPSMSGATAEPPQDGSYELFAYESRPAGASPDAHWGGHMALNPPLPGDAAPARVDFHAQRPGPRPGERQFVREFRALFELPESGRPGDARPFTQLAGSTLSLALGAHLPLLGWERSALVGQRVVEIRWR
ncbi:MAG: Ankyrin [Pseudomonadota bacterium]|jgi:hypothetical protein